LGGTNAAKDGCNGRLLQFNFSSPFVTANAKALILQSPLRKLSWCAHAAEPKETLRSKAHAQANCLLELATVSDDNGLGGLATAAAVALDLLHHIHALGHASKDDVLACRPIITILTAKLSLKLLWRRAEASALPK